MIVHEETYHGSVSSMVDLSPKLSFMSTQGSSDGRSRGWQEKEWVHQMPLPNAFNGSLVGRLSNY